MNLFSDPFSLLGVHPIRFLPLAVLITFFLFIIVWFKSDEKRVDNSSQDLLTRIPGQSTAKRMNRHCKKVVLDLLEMFLFIFLWLLLSFKSESIANILSPLLAVLMATWMVRTYLILRDIRRCSLEQKGTQLTAQHLQQLLVHGYSIYHDLILDSVDIDHVAVGPNGIFAIETITKQKRKKRRPERSVVIYDSKGLTFPGKSPKNDLIEQANKHAAELQKWMNTEIKESFRAMPILSLPGWEVKRKIRENPPVLNPKELHHYILDYGVQCLWSEELHKINSLLKDKSRQVTISEQASN